MLKKPDGTTAERKQRLTMIANNISKTMMFFFCEITTGERRQQTSHTWSEPKQAPH